MALFEKHLFLKKSQIPGAGKGLFTRIDISKGQLIVEYKGKLVLWKDVKHEDGYNLKSFGRYANDARGFSKITGLKNNSEYVVKRNKCYLSAIRKIHKGEEILIPYGKAYWDLMRKIST
jgi:hypothetical protein